MIAIPNKTSKKPINLNFMNAFSPWLNHMIFLHHLIINGAKTGRTFDNIGKTKVDFVNLSDLKLP